MIVFLYSVFDSKLATFSPPRADMTDAAAIRWFSDTVNQPDPKNSWHRHSEDYSLFRIGAYDDESGTLNPPGVSALPVSLVTASAVKENLPIENGMKPALVN